MQDADALFFQPVISGNDGVIAPESFGQDQIVLMLMPVKVDIAVKEDTDAPPEIRCGDMERFIKTVRQKVQALFIKCFEKLLLPVGKG